jgi:hemolysin III
LGIASLEMLADHPGPEHPYPEHPYPEHPNPDHPRLRGRIHQVAAVASVAGLVWMIADAHTPTAVVAAVVYGLAAIALYATSSSYHLYTRAGRARTVLRRLDHSMIYVLIAGTYTPVCLLALHGSLRWALLAVVWAVALAGVTVTVVAFDRFPNLTFVLSLVLGWAALLVVPELMDRPRLLALAALGGVLYTAGAILFALHWPGRAARWFGYHECWHAFGVAAGAAFFTLNLGLIAGS